MGEPTTIETLAGPERRMVRERRRRALHHQQRRGLLLAATLVGIATGALSVAYRYAASVAEQFSSRIAHELWHFGFVGLGLVALGGAALGWMAGFITERYAPEAGGSGIPHVKAVLMNLRTMHPSTLLPVKFVGGWLALAAGMSLGREGPTIQMGSALGQLVSKLAKVPRRSRNLMIAAGAGAGLAGAFNAPLAGFMFVMEELKLAMTPVTYGVALFATVAAVAVTRLALGQVPDFMLRNPEPVPLGALWAVALLGGFCGLIGILYNRLLIGALDLRARWKLSRANAAALVGCVVAVLMIWLPTATGGGHGVTSSILNGEFARIGIWMCAGLLAMKLLTTSASYGTGVPGGIFAPMLVIGSLSGFLVGTLVNQVLPGAGVSPAVFATLGMACVLASSVQAPLTGVVLIFEMTAEYNLLYALLLGSFIAYGVSDLLREKPIYEALLERDLHGGESTPESFEPLEIELTIQPDSIMDGRAIKNLDLPPSALIIGISRDGRRILPRGPTRLRSGDMLMIHIEGENPEATAVVLQDASRAP